MCIFFPPFENATLRKKKKNIDSTCDVGFFSSRETYLLCSRRSGHELMKRRVLNSGLQQPQREARPGTAQCLLSEGAVNNVNGNEEEPELALSILR